MGVKRAALPLLLLASPALPAAADALLSGPFQPLVEVLGEPRSPLSDLVILRTDDCLAGRVALDAIEMETPVGPLSVPTRRVAWLDLGREAGLPEQLTAVNGDRFTGIILHEYLPFDLAGGQRLRVPRCLVDRVIFRLREDETAGIPHRQWIKLTNGDHFSGALTIPRFLPVSSGESQSTGLEPGGPSLLERLEPCGWSPGAKIWLLAGGPVEGDLSSVLLKIEPDIGAGRAQVQPLLVPLARVHQVIGLPDVSPPEVDLPPSPSPPQVVMGIKEIELGGTTIRGDLTDGPDLFCFRAERGRRYKIQTANLVGCDTVLTLMRPDGSTSILENDDGPERGSAASLIRWTCDADGLYCVRVRDLSGTRRGTYTLRVEHAESGLGGAGTSWIERMTATLRSLSRSTPAPNANAPPPALVGYIVD
jgi:hypothetical protein